MNLKKLAIFASGSGTNAENIIRYFSGNKAVQVCMILSNNKDACVLERAKKYKIPAVVFDRDNFYKTDEILNLLVSNQVFMIVLAGFLWLIPLNILRAYPQRIINIHPALLPKYGGKGMYGSRVHQAVIDNRDPESGITIHYVNEEYDKGNIIFQTRCEVLPSDTPESLADRVHQLEYKYYPEIIGNLIRGES